MKKVLIISALIACMSFSFSQTNAQCIVTKVDGVNPTSLYPEPPPDIPPEGGPGPDTGGPGNPK
jgi:hypothetical protein